ncbi:MAG: PA14 domain-containing protein [Limisphaerales bacterium]
MKTCLRALCLGVVLAGMATVAAAPHGLNERPSFAAFHGGRLPPDAPTFSGNWSAVVAFPNLTFLNAMGLLPMPGTSNLVVWEREGRIYHFPNERNTTARTLVLDLSPQCQGWDDSGLLGIAFHPGFETNRHLFIYYTYVTPGTVRGSATARPPTATPNRDRLERYTLDANGVAIPGSVVIFIDQRSETVWHNGGGMFFHPRDGFLYLTNGDDANGGNNQRINTSLHSGILRIDVDQRGGDVSHPIPKQPLPGGSRTANYYIPNDNPFVGQAGVLEEFFALGLRSPHRMTIDPPTGRIFIGDVGEGSWEELSIIEPGDAFGRNFQWNRIEGRQGRTPAPRLTAPYIGIDHPAAVDYSHSEGAAIIGGYVYRGTEFAADLGGKYVFGDNIANVVWLLDESTTPPTKRLLCTLPRGPGPNPGNDYVGLSSFGYDHGNELYLCQLSSLGGRIYRLQRGGPPAPRMPRLLSESGVFTNLATLAAVPGLIPYTVNSPLWSDGALKLRWMGIPDGTTIGFATNGEWGFPDGSVWVKHFDLPVNDGDPAARRRLETRLLVRGTNGYVYGASYRWRPDHSDAEIVEGAQAEEIPILVPRPVGGLASADIGGPVAGSTADLGDGYRLTAGGADIWGTSDQFRYAYEQRTGDFDVAVRVASLTETDLYTKAGLMVRDSLNPNARHIFALVFPSNAPRNNNDGGYEFQSRDTVGGSAAAIYPPVPNPRVGFPSTWLRLKRAGQVWTAWSGADGETWRLTATKTLALPDTVYFGLALTAHTAGGARATAEFRFRQQRSQTWYYPSRQDCLSCHTRAAGGVLGVKTRQSNGDFHFPQTGVTDNQLRAWNQAGYFAPALDEAQLAALPAVTTVTNDAASLEHRARSYLDANCSHCHRPGGVNANWDARIETPLGLAGILGGTVQNDLGIPGARNVVARDLARSVLYQRVATATASHKMPPIAKNVVDGPALLALAGWILSLDPPPEVALTSPAPGALFYTPANIPLTATASSSNGSIVRIEYYRGAIRLGEATEPPFRFDWSPDSGGTFELTAFATDSAGQTGKSAPVGVTVIGRDTPGLLAEYHDNINFTGRRLTRVDPTVNFDWGNGPPDPQFGPDTFSVRWTGRVRPGVSGTHRFYTTVDDGVRLWVDGRQMINRWVDQPPTEHSATITLEAGRLYAIRMDYFENGGGAVARLEWSVPGLPREVVPAGALLPPAPPNLPPVVGLAVPAGGSAFLQPAFLDLLAEASDPDGRVTKVEFFAGATRLGESTNAPFAWRWPQPPAGLHSLTALATDEAGATATSPPVAVTVTALQILLPPQPVQGGRFQISFATGPAGRYRVEASMDLVHWTVIEEGPAGGGVVRVSELLGPTHRFFRVMLGP